MSNYTKATNFASKDALLTGNPLKIITGTGIDDEFNAIAIAVATKADTSSLASYATSTALTDHVDDTAGAHASSAISYVQGGTGSTSTDVQTKLREVVSVKDFGAVADGVDTGTTFTGTDNTSFFQAALDYCGQQGKALYIPTGKYYFAKLTAAANALTLSYDNHTIYGDGADSTELLIDEDLITLAGSEDFFRTSSYGTSTSRTLRGTLELYGFSMRGRWSHSPAQNDGTHFLTVQNFTNVKIHDFAARDCRGKFSRSAYIDSVQVNNSTFERISSDCLRFTDAGHAVIIGNTFKWTDDDCIALHAPSTVVPSQRSSISITGNTFEQCESVLALGAKHTVVTGNTFKLCKAAALYIGGVVSTEGDTASFSVVVTGNSIVDQIMRYDAATNLILDSTDVKGAIVVASRGMSSASTSAYAGRPNSTGTAFIDPIGTDDNGDFMMYNFGNTTQSIPAGMNFIVSNNSVMRTLPPTTLFSDYGVGEMFSGADGFVDPQVFITNFVTNGICLLADMRNAVVSGNVISGFRSGAGVYLFSTASTVVDEYSFDNILVSENSIKDCMYGLTHSQTAAAVYYPFSWGVTVSNNIIDCDPYHVSSARTSPLDGTWQTATVFTRPIGVFIRQVNGFNISNNVFANCYEPVSGNSSVITGIPLVNNNILKCDPEVVGVHASNKGICDVGYGGGKFIHQVTMCDPRTQTARSVTLTRSGTTVTATSTAHGLAVGTSILIAGANETGYLGQWIVATVPTADTFTFTIVGAPTTPATGTITATPVSYGKHIFSPLIESSTVPTLGKYVTGHFVKNTAPTTSSSKTTLGWVRQTVGTAHTVATTTTADWSPIVATTS